MSITKIKNVTKNDSLDRSKPPKSGKPKDVNFPKFFEMKTANGITVLVIEDKRLPLITSRFVFKSGSYMDYFSRESVSGLSSVTSELLTKGTKSRTATQIAEETDYIGAVLSSGCDYDATYISSYSLKKYFDNIFDIISDVILNPEFSEEEITRLKEQRINSLLSMIDEGDYLSDKIFRKKVYSGCPYALPVEGTRESINKITRKDIVSLYEKVFFPCNLVVAFVGDISPEEAISKINEKFSLWKKNPVPETEIILPEISNETKIYLTEKKGAVQSSLKLGHIGISRNNPDFIPVSVMNVLFGGYFTSRINKNLREQHGYTYGARSHFHANKYAGDFVVATEIKNEITSDTINQILIELEKLRNSFVSESELQNVKNYISGSFPLQLETPNAIASKVINLKLHGFKDDYYNSYIRKVNQLTKEDIKLAAEKYLYPDRLIISIAGDANSLKDEMKKFGKVEVIEEAF